MRVEPYLFFDGRCEEALAFYRRTLGADVALVTRFKDLPGMQPPPGAENKVMHAMLRIGDTTVLASDGKQGDFQGFSLSLSASSDAEAERLFAALVEGGRVFLPIAPTPFASRFGMVADAFGVLWTVVHQTPAPQAHKTGA
jgi:PhnB protein